MLAHEVSVCLVKRLFNWRCVAFPLAGGQVKVWCVRRPETNANALQNAVPVLFAAACQQLYHDLNKAVFPSGHRFQCGGTTYRC